MRYICGLVMVLALGVSVARAQFPFGGSFGQDRGSYGHDRGSSGHDHGSSRSSYDDPPRTLEEAQDRMRRSESFLQMADTNHNGILDANEVDSRQRFLIDRIIARAGIQPNYPVAIDTVRQGLQRFYQSALPPGQYLSLTPMTSSMPIPGQPYSGFPMFGPMSPFPFPGQPYPPPGMSLSQTPSSTSTSQSSASATTTAAAATSLVPGFGVNVALPPVPGFGPVATTPTSIQTTSPAASSSASKPSGPSSSSEDERKMREYAKGIMSKYDKNHDNVLDKDELKEASRMSGEVDKIDKNHDGKMTEEEVVAWVRDRNQRSSGDHNSHSATAQSSGKPSDTSAKSADVKPKSYRARSALERLPAGTPPEFLKMDANQDGQISMDEFCKDLSDAQLTRFFSYDLNSDGVVTADEYLRVEKSKPKTASTRPERK